MDLGGIMVKSTDEINKMREATESLESANERIGGKGNLGKLIEGSSKNLREDFGLEKELYNLDQQQKIEKKRINEKQIRSLRNRYSQRGVAGALLSENPRGVGLGDAVGLPTKLGSA